MKSDLTSQIEAALETPDELCKYLQATPTRPHKCGNMLKCVLANFISDTFLTVEQVVAVSLGEATIYNGARIKEVMYSGGIVEQVAKLDGSMWPAYENPEKDDPDRWDVDLPEWCNTVINQFDELGIEVTSLDVLQEDIVPGCSVGGSHEITVAATGSDMAT